MDQTAETEALPRPPRRTARVPDPRPAGQRDLVARLHRVEGQIGGVVRMLEARRDCSDVVTQLAAASHALDRVGFLLVAAELRSCLADVAESPDDHALAARAAAVEKLFLSLA